MWDITHVHFYVDNIGLAQKSGSIRVVNATPYSALDFMFNEKIKTVK